MQKVVTRASRREKPICNNSLELWPRGLQRSHPVHRSVGCPEIAPPMAVREVRIFNGIGNSLPLSRKGNLPGRLTKSASPQLVTTFCTYPEPGPFCFRVAVRHVNTPPSESWRGYWQGRRPSEKKPTRLKRSRTVSDPPTSDMGCTTSGRAPHLGQVGIRGCGTRSPASRPSSQAGAHSHRHSRR